jgi:predicted DNA-binding transcriptional regulator YafY
MTVHKFSRLLLLAATVKTNAEQTPEQLWRSLGVKKAQYHRDKKALEEIDFVFKYDRKQRRFVIDKEPFLPVFDLQLTETFALTMAVRQLSAAGDYLLTYDALAAINKIIANAPGPQRELLSERVVFQFGIYSFSYRTTEFNAVHI